MHLNEVIDEADKDHVSSHDDEGNERDESHKLPKNEEEDKIGHDDVSMESLEKLTVDEENKGNDVSKNSKEGHLGEIHSVDNLPDYQNDENNLIPEEKERNDMSRLEPMIKPDEKSVRINIITSTSRPIVTTRTAVSSLRRSSSQNFTKKKVYTTTMPTELLNEVEDRDHSSHLDSYPTRHANDEKDEQNDIDDEGGQSRNQFNGKKRNDLDTDKLPNEESNRDIDENNELEKVQGGSQNQRAKRSTREIRSNIILFMKQLLYS